MVDVISSIGNAISVVKKMKDVNSKIASADFSNLLADLYIELSDAKMALVDIKEENTKLKSQILKLKKKDEEKLTYEEPYYFRYKGDKKDGPFCQRCY